jgi:hypothetical protein
MTMNRRRALQGLAGCLAASLSPLALSVSPKFQPRCRVILDNDLAGDPDGLFQFVHHLLSPTADIRLVIGSHFRAMGEFGKSGRQSADSAAKAVEVLDLMHRVDRPRVVAGVEARLDPRRVVSTPAADAIIAEAMRDDTSLPLFYCAGAGLTDLATALLIEPRIAGRMTLAWIGGGEHPGLGLPLPGPRQAEYNTTIDIKAVQQVFAHGELPLWQVPRDVYRQMLVSHAELEARVRPTGPLGAWLVDQIDGMLGMIAALPPSAGIRLGETYVLGDSPLVTVTVLQTFFEPDTASSPFVTRPRPTITDEGWYGKPSGGKPIRVYTHIDARLTFEDLYAKLAAFGKSR